jgi:hypothetical protein
MRDAEIFDYNPSGRMVGPGEMGHELRASNTRHAEVPNVEFNGRSLYKFVYQP